MGHLELAKQYWKKFLLPGDRVIDATCGNGHDTLYLTELGVEVFAYDVLSEAIQNAQKRVGENRVTFRHQSHEKFLERDVKLVVYNLGYLPGGDKSKTTRVSSTLKSLKDALQISEMISVTCYPGHAEGAREEKAVKTWAENLDKKDWTVSYHQWLNRKSSPTLFIIKKVPQINKSSPSC